MITQANLFQLTTDEFLEDFNPMFHMVDPRTISERLLDRMITRIRAENAIRDKDMRIKIPLGLPPEVVAHILRRLHNVVRLTFLSDDAGDQSSKALAMYRTDGPDEGLYVVDDAAIEALIREYNYNFRDRDVKDVLHNLMATAPVKHLTIEPDLVAVNNGIFDYRTKTLEPFDPEYVFVSKSRVDYDPSATNPIIRNSDGTTWDVESWVNSLSDDPHIRDLLWEIIGAIVRPSVSWDRALILYATSGNNGKGTFCTLLRNLCGPGTHTSIPLANMSKDFMLESLLHATSIITDENDVGLFLDKVANFKALVTHDVIQLNRKNEKAVTLKFRGLIVQCMNEMPKVKDKSDSFARRLLIVPFDHRFQGKENKSIKDDYLHRKDVLEYVLNKVLNTNYYSFSEPESCLTMVEEFKTINDPVRQFLTEILPQARWQMLPNEFLYDLFTKWFRATSPSGTTIGRNTFINSMRETVESMPEWGWKSTGGKPVCVKKDWMARYEPLLEKYGLTAEWGADVLNIGPVPPGVDKAHLAAIPGDRFMRKTVRGLLRMEPDEYNKALETKAANILSDFTTWFWDASDGGLEWWLADIPGDVDKFQKAHDLAWSRDNMYKVMASKSNYEQHRLLDTKYTVDELVNAVQDHYFRAHGEDDPDTMRGQADAVMAGYATWFWDHVVEYQFSEPHAVTVAPANAIAYAQDRSLIANQMSNAVDHYQDEALVKRFFTTDEIIQQLQDYWFKTYGGPQSKAG